MINDDIEYKTLAKSWISEKQVKLIQYGDKNPKGIPSNIPLTIQWILLKDLLRDEKINEIFQKSGDEALVRIGKYGISAETPTEEEIYLYTYTPVYEMSYNEIKKFSRFITYMTYLAVGINMKNNIESVENLMVNMLHDNDKFVAFHHERPWWIISEEELSK